MKKTYDELNNKDFVGVRGIYRLQITAPDDENKIVGDSGWRENAVTNDGFGDYLVKLLAAAAGSKTISHIALGTGGAPAVTTTQLPGEIMSSTQRQAVTTSNVGSKTLRLTATWASSDNFLSAASNLSNIGLYNSSNAGTLFAGNTYTSSSCDTNQNVNATYEVQFS